MMIVLALFLWFFSSHTAPPQEPPQDYRFQSKFTIFGDDFDLSFSITNTNTSRAAITAVLVGCQDDDAGETQFRSLMYFDSILDSDDFYGSQTQSEIPFAGKFNKQFHWPDYTYDSCKKNAGLKAVLFADGTSSGEQTAVQELIAIRHSVWKENESVIEILRSTAPTIPAKQLLTQLRRASSIRTGTASFWISGGVPFPYLQAFFSLAMHRDSAGNETYPQEVLNQALEPHLRLRQRLLDSKPSFAEIEQKVNAVPPEKNQQR
jgi:hypothetical protein